MKRMILYVVCVILVSVSGLAANITNNITNNSIATNGSNNIDSSINISGSNDTLNTTRISANSISATIRSNSTGVVSNIISNDKAYYELYNTSTNSTNTIQIENSNIRYIAFNSNKSYPKVNITINKVNDFGDFENIIYEAYLFEQKEPSDNIIYNISFSVSKEWIADNEIVDSMIKVFTKQDDKWIVENATLDYFNAYKAFYVIGKKTPGYFVIGANKQEVDALKASYKASPGDVKELDVIETSTTTEITTTTIFIDMDKDSIFSSVKEFISENRIFIVYGIAFLIALSCVILYVVKNKKVNKIEDVSKEFWDEFEASKKVNKESYDEIQSANKIQEKQIEPKMPIKPKTSIQNPYIEELNKTNELINKTSQEVTSEIKVQPKKDKTSVELQKFVNNSIMQGYSEDSIKQVLSKKGYVNVDHYITKALEEQKKDKQIDKIHDAMLILYAKKLYQNGKNENEIRKLLQKDKHLSLEVIDSIINKLKETFK